MYIIDLNNYIEDSKINLFAYKTASYTESTSQIDLMLIFGIELASVDQW